MKKILTTAPESYDGFSTKTIVNNFCVYKGMNEDKNVRLVQMEDCDYNWQNLRYSSGLHLSFDFVKDNIEDIKYFFKSFVEDYQKYLDN